MCSLLIAIDCYTGLEEGEGGEGGGEEGGEGAGVDMAQGRVGCGGEEGERGRETGGVRREEGDHPPFSEEAEGDPVLGKSEVMFTERDNACISFRSEQEQEDSGVREGPLGGMRGVKVTKSSAAGVGGGSQQAAPVKGGPPATKSASPPLAPPSSQPVELFLRDSNTGGRGRGGGGAGGGGLGLLPPMITTETAKNEIQWHTWRLECHIKKVSTTIFQLALHFTFHGRPDGGSSQRRKWWQFWNQNTGTTLQ